MKASLLIPATVINNDRLSDRAFRLYALLKAHGDQHETPISVLRAEVGWSADKFQTAVSELHAAGLVTHTRTGRANRWRVK